MQQTAQREREDDPKGFDFGCLPYAMAAGVYEFPQHLHDSSINGVAYGFARSIEIDRTVPTISLVAQNEGPLTKAFETFNEWAEVTDPDSLEVIIVFRSAGGYVLALSPEPNRLLRRCLGYDRASRPLIYATSWFKPIDSVNPILHKIREYSKDPIAPYYLDGAIHPGPLASTSGIETRMPHPVSTIEPLLKFEISFFNERDVEPNTLAWSALKIADDTVPTQQSQDPSPHITPSQVAEKRRKTLRAHFPVTLERLRRSPEIRDLVIELSRVGIAIWQTEQALCNLILSQKVQGCPHYLGISSDKVEEAILQALRDRYEIADSQTVHSFSVDEVPTQILADANALLKYIGKVQAKDLPTAIAALRLAAAFDATSAIADPPTTWTSTP